MSKLKNFVKKTTSRRLPGKELNVENLNYICWPQSINISSPGFPIDSEVNETAKQGDHNEAACSDQATNQNLLLRWHAIKYGRCTINSQQHDVLIYVKESQTLLCIKNWNLYLKNLHIMLYFNF